MVSGLGLHCVSVALLWDVRLKWVNFSAFCSSMHTRTNTTVINQRVVKRLQ